jgi:hypothetical protein
MTWGQFLVRFVLVGVSGLLTTLAYASPPDPSWIAGLWDGGDHDDVVIRITASTGVVESSPRDEASSILPFNALRSETDDRRVSSHTSSVSHARAPPAL